ncbi:MAG: hypothetical protein NC904_07260, partial [Candidatus Omnitrophica bacterium]|nr:hypothetical protein [Candidatus Omnitrophota bacterium]
MYRIIFLVIGILVFSFLGGLNLESVFSIEKEPIYIIPIKDTIDLGLSAFVKRVLEEAKLNKSPLIILEIDTWGGRVDAALEICKYLEEIKPTKTIAYILDKAWSAGALISLACDTIIMDKSATIGSAEPKIGVLPTQQETIDEKALSAIRAKFKALAETHNYPVNLALAMVDKNYEIKQVRIKDKVEILTSEEIQEIKPRYKEEDMEIIKTIKPQGKLLNLTALESKEYNLAKEILNNREEVIKYFGLEDRKIILLQTNWSEKLVRFLTHPLVSPLLLSLGFLGILFELKMPGWGISGSLGVLLLALFFWGHYLAGLAGWTEMFILLLGIILLIIEIFVLPGFSITGITGIILIIIGIFLSMVKTPFLNKLQFTRA